MPTILHHALPDEMTAPAQLPGVAPCGAADWVRVDEAYGAQMAYRRALLQTQRSAVYWSAPDASEATAEVLQEAVLLMPGLGFKVDGQTITCPDGHIETVDPDAPLLTLGRALQEDICIMQKQGDEHVLTAAVLCFPANWRLAEKAGRPLTDIHIPVEVYDDALARRVQRLFDGVRVGRPLWRSNWLTYAEPDLHQPSRRRDDRPHIYVRTERQCILRLPRTNAVVFSIHTYVLDRTQAEAMAPHRTDTPG